MGMKLITPLYDRIVVKLIEKADDLAGAIIIPETAKERPSIARVVAVGGGHRTKSGALLPLCVKEGDRVLLGKYSGNEISIDGHHYVVMREDEVIGVIEQQVH